jgi:4-amino-4-deoxy-L-arabinose transferase-like glycosyltransferase
MAAMHRFVARAWWQTALIVAIGLLLHGRTFLSERNLLSPDSPSYIEPAGHLLREGTFVARDCVAFSVPPNSFPDGPVMADTIRTPVYPLVIAGILGAGGSLRLLVALQHLLAIGVAVAMHRLLGRVIPNVAAFAAAVMFVAHPAVVDTANLVLTETLASALVAAAAACFYLSQRRSAAAWAVASGLLFGVATLTRPIVLYGPIVLAVLLFARRRPRIAVAFVVAAALLPGAWAWRNYRAAGVATVSSIEGEDILLYRAGGALTVSTKDVPSAVFALQKNFGYYGEALHRRVPLINQALDDARAAGWNVDRMNHAQRARFYTRRGLAIVAAHPVAYAEVVVSALIALFVDDLSSIAAAKGAHIDTARLFWMPISLLLVVSAVAGLARLFRTDRDLAWTLLALLGYFTVASAGPGVGTRFVVTFLPLYAAAAGVGLAAIAGRIAVSIARRAQNAPAT